MSEVASTKNVAPVVGFKRDLDRLNEAGELVLPSTVSYGAFKNAAVVAFTDNPHLMTCNKESLFKSIRTLAAAGLVPDGREAAIVPFKGDAQAMPMVYGLVKVARNSGKVVSLFADVVYENETLDIWVEDGERKWAHVKTDGSRIDAMDRGGDIKGAYAVAKLVDGTVEFKPMTLAEIEKRRLASPQQRGNRTPIGIWEKWYEEMAMKTVIRSLCKLLPMSSEDIDRLMVEQEPLLGAKDVTPEPEPERENLAQRMKKAEEPDPDGDTIDGVAGHWTDAVDTSGAFPGSGDFDEGVQAHQDDIPRIECPHTEDLERAADWLGGWDTQEQAEGGSIND